MTNVEPLHTFNLDPSQQQAFVRFYRNLPERPISTVRFFNHGDFYTVHGQDASLAVETVVGSKVVKYMGVEPKLSYVVLGTSNFTRFLRELLLVKQYRVEVFVKTSQGRNNDWKVEYKGSPGNLSAFEDLIFKDDEAVVNTWVIAVNPLRNKTLAVGCVNTTDFKFSLSEFVDNDFYTELEALLAQINPKECLIPTGDSAELVALDRILSRNDKLVIKIKRSDFKADDVYQDLDRLLYFKDGQQRNAQSLTETNQEDALGSLQAVLRHLNLTSDDTQFNQYRFSPLDVHGFVRLDGAAMSALNLFPKPEENGKSFKSVFEVFNCCVTAQGRRLLEQWFRKPLRDLNLISDRLEVVDCIINDAEMRSTLRTSCLTRTPDMLMLTKKLSNKKASLQDCYKIYQIVDSIPGMLATLTNGANKYIKGTLVDPLTDLNKDMEKFQNLIETTLDMDLVDRGEFLVKPTFDDELKELYEKKQNLEEKMQRALKSAAADLGMDAGKTIKLECTDQLGYFYKVTLKDEKLLRDSKRYETVATVKSGVRFTDKHLKELNEDYMDVCRSYEDQQKMVVKQILDVAAGYADTLRNLNLCIAQVDVLTTFAHVGTTAPGVFVKPTLLPEGSGVLRLTKARHPCVEKQDNVSYIPNNLDLRQGKTILNIITGPNMGGKSTYMRSVALCVFLAHVGSFVPCADAEISLVDCILTRVGSSDCELKGLSTFMMEMVETCGIVRSATSKSLVVIDELGRGTSTYDGCSIAWSIAEYLVKEIKSFTLFATHFHEITNLATLFPDVENLHVSAVVTKDTITPLYQIKEGACDKSYGVHCARMAEFPKDVIELAEEHQRKLEFSEGMKYINDFEFTLKRKMVEDGDAIISDVMEKIGRIDLDAMTDEEVLSAVNDIKESISKDNLFLKGLIESV